MDVGVWDSLEEQIAVLVLEEDLEFSAAISQVCAKNADQSAETLLLASISFLTDIDTLIGTASEDLLAQSHKRYRIIAALTADVALLPIGFRKCANLMEFWANTKSTVFNARP